MGAKVYVCAVDTWGLRGLDAAWTPLLSDVRRAKMRATASAAHVAQSLGAELALIGALRMRDPGFSPPADYECDPSGAPVMTHGFLSLTHTPGLSACAICGAPVGIDAEGPRPIPDALARRTLSPDESADCRAATDPARRFLVYWTGKEARFKCAAGFPKTRTLCLPGGYVLSVAAPEGASLVFQRLSYQALRRQ